MTSSIVHIDQKPVVLAKQIGKGGEGEIYQLAGDTRVAVKIYSQPKNHHQKKVNAIVTAGLANRTSHVAFPIRLVTDPKGRFVGFAMNMVEGSKLLHELYAPKARKQNFPQIDYRFLVRTAMNLASAVALVHEKGCVIGDINHSGFMVSERAMVSIIDADSFQFHQNGHLYPCTVGVPEYTPPELQGQRLSDLVRTVNHDAFGIAVVIFQLLFMGKHPFAGRYSGSDEMPLEKAIAESRYAYSVQRQTGMSTPPGATKPSIMPEEIADAFERAFGAVPDKARPTPAEWSRMLQRLEKRIVRCHTIKEHYYPQTATTCPWCDIEQQFGAILFLPQYVPGATPSGIANFELNRVWAAIEAVRLPELTDMSPKLPTAVAKPEEIARETIQARRFRKCSGAISLIGAGSIMFAAPTWFFVAVGLGVFAVNRFIGDVEQAETIKNNLDAARKNFERELATWYMNCGIEELGRIKAMLKEARTRYLGLPDTERTMRTEYERDRRKQQLDTYLDQYRLAFAKIKTINRGLVQTLIAYGFETAADIKEGVTVVPGIGEVRKGNLVAWRKKHEASFTYSPKPTPTDALELRKINNKIAQLHRDLQQKLVTGADALKDAVARLENTKRNPHQNLVAAFLNWKTCAANAKAIGLTALPPSMTPTVNHSLSPTQPIATRRSAGTVTNAPTRPSQGRSSINCPSCGSSMVRRKAKRGRYSGKYFWGCSRYPNCKGIRNVP